MKKLRKFRCHYLIPTEYSLKNLDQIQQIDLTINLYAKDRSDILKQAIEIAKETNYILQDIEEV